MPVASRVATSILKIILHNFFITFYHRTISDYTVVDINWSYSSVDNSKHDVHFHCARCPASNRMAFKVHCDDIDKFVYRYLTNCKYPDRYSPAKCNPVRCRQKNLSMSSQWLKAIRLEAGQWATFAAARCVLLQCPPVFSLLENTKCPKINHFCQIPPKVG